MHQDIDNLDFNLLFNSIISSKSTNGIIKPLLEKLEKWFIKNLIKNSETDFSDTILSQGIAINTELAAQCFSDYLRTHHFMVGTYQCALDLLNKNPSIRILYAGTGPFATIILPLLYLLSPEQIHITTLEINQDSHNLMRKLISILGKEPYFESTLLQDAITYTTNEKFDLIISETMDKALTREPQLAVFGNLIKCLRPEGRIIPEKITVDLYATKIALEKPTKYNYVGDTKTRVYNQKFRHYIGNVIVADKFFFQNQNFISGQNQYLKTISTKDIPLSSAELMFITEVIIYNNILLMEDDSFITRKYVAYSIPPTEQGMEYDLYYANTETPSILIVPKVLNT